MQAERRLQKDVQLLQEDSVHVDVMITMHCRNWASYVVPRVYNRERGEYPTPV